VSKIQLSPYVNFQGRAREAMQFYHKVLGGKLELQTLNEQGGYKPAGPGESIRHSRLEADGALIIATDGHPDYPAKVGENMAIALGGTDNVRLAKIFNDLAEGGKIQMPLSKQPWGAEVGWLTDKFGINWTVNIDKP
jgi:PhnB protein